MLILKYSAIFLHLAIVLAQAAELPKKPDEEVIAAPKTAVEVDPPKDPISSTDNITTIQTPNITTPSPPATTTVTTTSTSSPTTTSAPAVDYWVIKENGVVCILAKMDIKLDLNFNHSKNYLVTVPKKAVANGSCGNGEQILKLSWDNNTVEMNFQANKTVHKYYLNYLEVNISVADNKTAVLSKGDIVMFETPLNHSYLCSYSDPLKFSESNETVQVSFSNIKLEAFKIDNSTKFSTISACPPDTPDIVPIVVGCALTILVIVVLIAYLVGRRRTQARGYLSM